MDIIAPPRALPLTAAFLITAAAAESSAQVRTDPNDPDAWAWASDDPAAVSRWVHPGLATSREAALADNVRLHSLLFFDLDADCLDDELAIVRTTDATQQYCGGSAPMWSESLERGAVVLKRSAQGWTPLVAHASAAACGEVTASHSTWE